MKPKVDTMNLVNEIYRYGRDNGKTHVAALEMIIKLLLNGELPVEWLHFDGKIQIDTKKSTKIIPIPARYRA